MACFSNAAYTDLLDEPIDHPNLARPMLVAIGCVSSINVLNGVGIVTFLIGRGLRSDQMSHISGPHSFWSRFFPQTLRRQDSC